MASEVEPETGMTVDEAADEDIAALVALWHRAGLYRPWNDPERDIAFSRRGPHSTVLVGRLDGRIVASAMVGEDGHRGWLYYVAVDPAFQRRGLGKAMMAVAETWLRRRGVWKVQLLVRRDNLAVRDFYSGLGYAEPETITMQKLVEPIEAPEADPDGLERPRN